MCADLTKSVDYEKSVEFSKLIGVAVNMDGNLIEGLLLVRGNGDKCIIQCFFSQISQEYEVADDI